MCGGCAPATGINSPPEGGVHAPLRASLARSPPRLGRSQAGGLHPQTPRAAPPGAPSRTGPLLPRSPSRRGSGHGCARWPGWSTACGCPRWTPSPSPSPLDSVFQKQGNRSVVNAQRCPPEGVSPCSGGGGQTSGPPARAAVHLGWAAGLSTARAGSGRSGRGCFSPRAAALATTCYA